MHAIPATPPGIRRAPVLLALALAALAGAASAGADVADGNVAAALADDGAFLRVVSEERRSVALEIAARSFARDDGPDVSLVGVVHIGDAAYYRAVQELLREFDVVLYESVKPAGAGGAGGDTDAERVASTRAALAFVAGLVELHRERVGRYPEDLDGVRRIAREEDPRLAAFLDVALLDAWGRACVYAPEAGEDGPATYRLLSRGADGREGGDGIDADLLAEPAVAPAAGAAGDRIQVQLADALGLSFQLDALDYGDERWRCSDLAMDQLERAMERRGSDFTVVESTLAGSTLPAQIAKFLLGLVRVADAFTDGAISDVIKVLMIEMLGDETFIEASLSAFDPGFAEVIIGDRNQVVADDLRRIAARQGDVRSIAVLYGAGHMPDLARRLTEQLGYRPAGARWLRAIEVDLARSPVSETDVRQLRLMMRRMMGQMRQR